MSHEREEHLNNHDIRLDFLQECLQGLNSSDQQLLKNAVFENQSVKEIARTAGKTIQTLYNRLSLLRRELAACISRKLQSGRQS